MINPFSMVARRDDFTHCNICFAPLPLQPNGMFDLPKVREHKKECFKKHGDSMVQGSLVNEQGFPIRKKKKKSVKKQGKRLQGVLSTA